MLESHTRKRSEDHKPGNTVMWPNERMLCLNSVAVNGVLGALPGILDVQQKRVSCDAVRPHRAWEGARMDRVVMHF